MASAAEQLAAHINFGQFAKATELKKRLWFTLGALVIYRLGTYIPVPGIDPGVLKEIFTQQLGGILGMFDMFAGGAFGRMTIFALGIMPYISAAIIMQLLTAVSPYFMAIKKEGEAGQKKINQYTRYGTVFLSTLQGYGIAIGLEGMTGATGSAVLDPGLFFRASTVITLVGGTMFLMWLGEQITARGVGNGISLIIFSGIVANLPSALAGTLELGRTGALAPGVIFVLLVMAVVVITIIVFVERAQRRLMVQYPKRQVGNKMFGGQSSHLPLKLNTAGVIPMIFASSLLLLPVTVAGFGGGQGPEWLNAISAFLGRLPADLRVADRVLRLLLHLGRVQPLRDRRESQEERRFHSGHPARQEYGGISRLCADTAHRGRGGLSGGDQHPAGDPDFTVFGAVLFRRNQSSDRRHGDHGHRVPGAIAPAGTSVRRADP